VEWRTSPTGDNFLGSLGYARKLSRDWTLLGRTLWDENTSDQLRGRSQLGLAWRQTDNNTFNALFRLENRYDRTNIGGTPLDESQANIAAVLLNFQPTPGVTFSGRYAGKISTSTADSLTTQTTAHLLMGRAIFDLTNRLDAGVIGSMMGDAHFSQRQYGIGAELGLVVMKNLRLAGGYNLFGFTDKDFESLGYTKRGPYVEFGFKFDEALFGAGPTPARKTP
jgi:hypothetical protein